METSLKVRYEVTCQKQTFTQAGVGGVKVVDLWPAESTPAAAAFYLINIRTGCV